MSTELKVTIIFVIFNIGSLSWGVTIGIILTRHVCQ